MAIPGRSRSASVLVASCCLAVVGFIVTGCGAAAPDTIGPTGIDELVIPTPAPLAADFVEGIDNPLLPLSPGSEWVYETVGADDGETTTVTVTDQSRRVQGVLTTVVRDVVRNEAGEVVEDTYDWFAQDQRGNVWYFGRDTASYDLDAGTSSTEGSWEAGVGGAQAGLVMSAVPRVGDGYQQGHFPSVIEDRATVLALDELANVEYDDFSDLVVIEESTPLDPGRIVRKYYARNVGLVLEEATQMSDGVVTSRTRTELVTRLTR